MITVFGATGHTGKVVAERLLDAGEKVRAIGRSADRLQPLAARGAEPAVGDIADAAFLTEAFRGADAAYVMVPPDYVDPDYFGRYARITDAVVRAIEQTGLRHVVFLSSLGAEHPSGTGPIVGLHRSEERLKQIPNLNLLILRPGYFYENLFNSLPLIKHQGINGGVIKPETPMGMTATQDIGAAAADALRARNFTGASVRELLGPRDVTLGEATRLIGERIGRPDLPYVTFADADLVGGLVQAGFAEPNAKLFVEMSQAFNDGRVRSLEGRHPGNTGQTTIESFADTLATAYKAL
jgi:uncharacterized protein YbjT (DUF2867 family)